MRTPSIPKEDLDLINASFKQTGAVETLGKNVHGRIIGASRQVVNDKTFTFKDFSGRILKHQMSVVIPGRGQFVIGIKGQKYDDISLEDRKLVIWNESDFE